MTRLNYKKVHIQFDEIKSFIRKVEFIFEIMILSFIFFSYMEIHVSYTAFEWRRLYSYTYICFYYVYAFFCIRMLLNSDI